MTFDHAFDHFGTECVDDADAFEGCHGAAQPIGLGRSESCGDDGDLHRLFLEEWNTKRLLKHLFKLRRGITNKLRILSS